MMGGGEGTSPDALEAQEADEADLNARAGMEM
jgi:hypothetical protein